MCDDLCFMMFVRWLEDGQISIGGGQLMGCSQLARIGQLLLNRGKWPTSVAPSWPMNWLTWATGSENLFQLVSEDGL